MTLVRELGTRDAARLEIVQQGIVVDNTN
jgi:hypothetical protein